MGEANEKSGLKFTTIPLKVYIGDKPMGLPKGPPQFEDFIQIMKNTLKLQSEITAKTLELVWTILVPKIMQLYPFGATPEARNC